MTLLEPYPSIIRLFSIGPLLACDCAPCGLRVERTPSDMLQHLLRHVDAGDAVPTRLLRAVARSKTGRDTLAALERIAREGEARRRAEREQTARRAR